MRYDSHSLQFSHLKCTIQWIYYIHQLQPSPQSVLELLNSHLTTFSLEHFHHLKKKPLAITSVSPLLSDVSNLQSNIRSFLFFWLVLAHRPGIKPTPSAVKARSPNPWNTREFPDIRIFDGTAEEMERETTLDMSAKIPMQTLLEYDSASHCHRKRGRESVKGRRERERETLAIALHHYINSSYNSTSNKQQKPQLENRQRT